MLCRRRHADGVDVCQQRLQTSAAVCPAPPRDVTAGEQLTFTNPDPSWDTV